MADHSEVDLDSIIDRLLEVRGSRPGKQVQLLEAEIRYLCTKAREIFISQPILLELEAPIKVWRLIIFTALPLSAVFQTIGTGCTADPWLFFILNRFAVIFTANTMTSSDCSSTVASLQRPTTYSLVTMSIVESSP